MLKIRMREPLELIAPQQNVRHCLTTAHKTMNNQHKRNTPSPSFEIWPC